jgi:hypothetical protein
MVGVKGEMGGSEPLRSVVVAVEWVETVNTSHQKQVIGQSRAPDVTTCKWTTKIKIQNGNASMLI